MITVAIDHVAASLTSYIGRAVSEAALINVRRKIASISIESGADLVLLNFEDFDWGGRKFGYKRVILGYPDQVFDKSRALNIPHQRFSGSIGISKLGIHFGGNSQSGSNAVRGVHLLLASLPKSIKMIIEPYFDNTWSDNQKLELLKLLLSKNNKENIFGFKLDLSGDDFLLKAYTTDLCGVPWYARSVGADYSDFYVEYKNARALGCSGVIAGAAIWKDQIRSILDTQSNFSSEISIISERLKNLSEC